tara:strand:+ start:144 stop:422 length:279 start_codon:yes stop_codon:yes gene_type:complete
MTSNKEVELNSIIAKLKLDIDILIAETVHIKSDLKAIQCKASNILTEWVLNDVNLIIHALDKPKPKINVASHKLSLVEEKLKEAIHILTLNS